MTNYLFSSTEQREVISCGANTHHNEMHPSRIMELHDLIIIRSGEWEIWQDGIPYHLCAGDAILLFAGCTHYGLTPCPGTVTTYFIHFTRQEGDAVLPEKIGAPDRGFYSFPVMLSMPPGSAVPYLFERVISSHWQRDIYASGRASNYLSLLLSEMSVLSAGDTVRADSAELVNRLISAIEATPERFYSVDELAAMINVSRKTLYNYFTRVTGASPHDFQIARKLDSAAADIARSPGTTLRELAARYGFCDEYHFAKLYKARFSSSPKAFKLY